MADFVKFGQGVLPLVRACAGNMDEAGTAAFLIGQQKVLQDKAVDDRKSGKQAGAGSGTGKATGAKSALDRLKAMTPK